MRYLIALAACLACFGLAACGDDNGGDGGGTEAKTLQPSQAQNASGDVTWCIGKDTSGAFNTAVETFNQQTPNSKRPARAARKRPTCSANSRSSASAPNRASATFWAWT